MESPLITWITVAVCAGLLTACGADGNEDSGGSRDSWRPDPSVPTELDGDGFTPPGAVLSVGDTATVPLLKEGVMDDPDVSGSLEVTVADKPVRGSLDDLPSDGPFADDMDGTPYYVTFTVTNVGKQPIDDLILRLEGVDTTGDDLDSSASSSLTACPSEVPQTFGPGESATTCSVVFVEDNDLAAVGYVDAVQYEDDPVLWDLT